MKILLAEDDFVTRKFMANFLSKYGECDVNGGRNGSCRCIYCLLWKTMKPYDLVCP